MNISLETNRTDYNFIAKEKLPITRRLKEIKKRKA
jgi:hypothetical protein